MLIKTSQTQNIGSDGLFCKSAIIEGNQNNLSNYLEKITSQNIGQVKIYLGMSYLMVVSILSFTLFY